MGGRFIVTPSRSDIMARSISYGAASGAATGVVVALPAVIGALFDPVLLIVVFIAASVGAIVGVACGLSAGLGLAAFWRAGTSRWAVRAVAAVGAALIPAASMVAVMVGSGHRWVPVLAALTIVVLTLAGALGPVAFYGKPRRRKS